MFVVQNRPINGHINTRHTEIKISGSQMDESSTNFLLPSNGRFCGELPTFFNIFQFKQMQNRIKKSKAPTKEFLAEVKSQLAEVNPMLKRVKVKKFYNEGRIVARAKLGNRSIFVRGYAVNIVDRFMAEYNEKAVTV